jgi:hypothetical protein
MSDAPRPSVVRAVLIAAVISWLVTALRLFGEHEKWSPVFFGGNLSIVGITWLLFPFAFWFGRRLAQNGHAPASARRVVVLHLVAFALVAGSHFAVRGIEDVNTRVCAQGAAVAVIGLAGLVAWPRAWLALASYGVLARLSVIVATRIAFANDWDTHFVKGPPNSDPADALFLTTVIQLTFWPLAFTTLVGGLVALLGARMARRAPAP